jgi:purine catabolism regulator
MVEMSVPIRWLVERRELGLTVLAGSDRLDRRVSWVHSIELADPVRWLDGGELLLTTGLRLPRSAADRRHYVESLDAAGVAAIGFGVGLSFERVPDAVVTTAERLGLPLLEVPLPTPFVAVTRAVSRRLAELEYEGVARAARGQSKMTRAALRGGPKAVVRELANTTGAGVALVGPDGKVVVAHGLRGRRAELATAVLADPRTDGPASRAGPDGTAIAQPVKVGRRVHGRLVLVSEWAATPADQLLLGHAVSLIALHREQPQRTRLDATLCGLVVDGNLDAERAAEYLAGAGLPVRDGIAVLAVLGGDPRRVLTAADRVLVEHELPLLGAVREECAIVLLPDETPDLHRALVGKASGGLAVTRDAGGLPAALRQAVTAARVAGSRDVPLVRFDSLAGQVLSATPATRAALAELAETRLRPLADADREGGTELVETLRAFLEHNGHGESASAALGVHRHTLRGRMDRVRTLLDVDLDSAHVRAELLLALTTWP